MRVLLLFILVLALSKTLFAQESEKVSLQLQWLHQFQFAGFYIAKEKGYYKEVGLEVDIKEFSRTTDVINEIQNQKATYAIGKSSLLIHQSKTPNLVILDAIFEHSPSVLIATNPEITHPHDLKNRRIMVTQDQALAASYYAMLFSQGVHAKDIIQQEHSFNLQDLINGKTDAMASYISNEPFRLQQKSIDFTILNPKDYGYDFYGDLLYTSKKELHEHPKRAKKFTQASRKGWTEAFKNIEVTAKLIFEKYNTQHKSLQHLIYEGKILKSLWSCHPERGPMLNYKRFDTMADFYLMNNLISEKPDLIQFLDPLNFNRKPYTIGILAKRGVKNTIERWEPLITHMNFELSNYNLIMRPLVFTEVEEAVKDGTVDFVLTNSMQYVQLEAKYGTSRLATLLNDSFLPSVSDYGAVIFTHVDNKDINRLKDAKNRTFGAVNPLSFGGWIMAKKTFLDNGVKEKDFKSVNFLQTHDNVVEAVLSKSVDVGTVRTDTLETLKRTAKIDLNKIKILNALHYDNFPYLVSTELYPEWSFAKMKNTDNILSSAVLSDLLNPIHLQDSSLQSWSIPLNYKPVHDLLKKLQLEPYRPLPLTLKLILKEYFFVILSTLILIIGLLLFNSYLKALITKKTKELRKVNKQLETLAQTDELTKIPNRRQFMKLFEKYFDVAKRNETPLVLLALDIDWFKTINDTYGHDVGDEVLKLFTKTVEKSLRKSDIFARIGGEEFSILLQNTTLEHSHLLAKKLCKEIEETPYILEDGTKVIYTLSIGMSVLNQEHNNLPQLFKSADKALYKAKEQGRNRVVVL